MADCDDLAVCSELVLNFENTNILCDIGALHVVNICVIMLRYLHTVYKESGNY